MSDGQTTSPATKETQEVDTVVIRFAGDSGDGMQLTGGRFTAASAIFGLPRSGRAEAIRTIRGT